jgi:hypothetical protein
MNSDGLQNKINYWQSLGRNAIGIYDGEKFFLI